VKVKDANDPAFVQFLAEKNYKVNKDKTKFGREKLVLQGIFSGLGFFGILVVALSLMLFSFYLQLMIARSKDNLQLLLTLGYSPAWLSKKVSARFIPVYLIIVLVALALTQVLQAAFSDLMQGVITSNPAIPFYISWIVVAIAVIMVLLSLLVNYRMVRRILYRMY
jgi:magnesium-transporting ATPase (P-type)